MGDAHSHPVPTTGECAHRENRVQEKALLPRLRVTNRPQPGYRLLAMGVGGKRGVLHEEVPTGRAELGPHQSAVRCLNRIRDNLAFVEEGISSVDVILAGEQLRDHLAGLLGKRLSKRHDPLPPSAIADPDPVELREPTPLAGSGELTSMCT